MDYAKEQSARKRKGKVVKVCVIICFSVVETFGLAGKKVGSVSDFKHFFYF